MEKEYVQATAAGRRCGRTSHGKSKIPAGRLCSSYSFHSSSHTSDVHVWPGRKEAKGKVYIHYKEIFHRDNRMLENGDN